jgi:transcriptional regulator with GAF, ATPase, and Fis domain
VGSTKQTLSNPDPGVWLLILALLKHTGFEVRHVSMLADAINLAKEGHFNVDLFIRSFLEQVKSNDLWTSPTLHDAVDYLERCMITDALNKHDGNISRTARELGLTRRGLQLKLKRFSKCRESK